LLSSNRHEALRRDAVPRLPDEERDHGCDQENREEAHGSDGAPSVPQYHDTFFHQREVYPASDAANQVAAPFWRLVV
jgi:hypothetical protein